MCGADEAIKIDFLGHEERVGRVWRVGNEDGEGRVGGGGVCYRVS